MCVIVGQAPVTEQPFSEQQALWVLGASGGDWGDRLLAGAWLDGWRLSGGRRGGDQQS